MDAIEYILLILLICLGLVASVSDIREGIIPNKILIGFAVCGIFLDIIYYIILIPDTVWIFIINVLASTVISVSLYYTHTLAGGDCKLIFVLSLLYPAGMYLSYGNNNITLFVTICFAVFFGYVYMLVKALWKLIVGDSKIDKVYIVNTVKEYFKSYIIASLFIMGTNLIFAFIEQLLFGVNSWVVFLTCIIVAWISGKNSIFRKRFAIGLIIIINIGLSVYMKLIPISLNPRAYLFTAFLLLCQMTIKTDLYESIQTSRIKKGMILSSLSSMMMQRSRIDGLPGISTEDLRDRLTEMEAESVRRWGNTVKGSKEVFIVKKIPFAIFIFLGYMGYYLIWRMVI